jgi:hypothetical protein
MADAKITALDAIASVATADVIPIVDDPSGTPVTKKATVAQVRTALMPVSLTADVTGTLPIGNGGTGATSFTADQVLVGHASALTTATNVKAGSGYVSIGATPATTGGLRLANNTFVYARDSANGSNVPVIGLSASDVIQIGNLSGFPIEINPGLSDPVTIIGQEVFLDGNAIQFFGTDSDFGGGVGVLAIDEAATNPTTNPTAGIVAYVDALDNTLKYRQADGTVVPLDSTILGLGTAGQVWRTNSGATAGEWSTFAGAGVVNVMDYYEVADGGASYNLGGVAVTTKNVANAFQAAYEDKIVTGQAFTLWLPPAADYGVTAYSWKEALTWDVSEAGDNVAGFEIVGSGVASIIIPDSSAALDEKLYIAGAGPDCLSMLFAYRRMFWVGDEDATSDCVSVLRTSVDMDVLIDECQFYSVQTSSATSGVVYLDTMGAIMRRTYFHGCTADNNGAVVYVGSGCFGATFEHVQWYPWEKGTNPFGGTHYDKGTLEARYHVIIAGGGTLQTASRVTFDNCTWAESGVYAAVKCDPGANLIDTVHFKNCTLYGNLQRMVECVANTRHVIVDGCSLSHNGAGVPTIDMQSSTCERLTIRGTEFSHSGLEIHADNSQLLVEVFSSEGGTYKVDGAAVFTVDAATTWHGLTSATAAPAARRPVTDITKNDATDLTLTATQYAYPRLNITGTPGGAFNVIAPNAADTEFMVINQTASACTIKKSGGTGITIAANKAAKVWHNGTDYIRLTADA